MGPRRSKRSQALGVGVSAGVPAAIPAAISSENIQSLEKKFKGDNIWKSNKADLKRSSFAWSYDFIK